VIDLGSCPGLDALNPVCQVGTVVAGVGSTVAGAGIDAVLSGLSQWVASGAEWLLGQIGAVLNSTTSVNLGAKWFSDNYGIMTSLAAVIVLPLLLVSTMQAIYRQNPAQLLRAFFVQLPLALLLGVASVQIVILSLSATDAMCSAVAGGASSSVSTMLSTLSQGLVAAVGDPTLATFVILLVGLLVAVASFVLWLELLVRAAAVYVAALFLPLALITLVWPSISHWCRRLVEILAALILSKFVIVATLSLAAGAIASGSGFGSVLAGGALLVLATFVPFAILRLIPMVEAGAVGHLEGVRQRGTAAVTRVPRSAASFALSEGMEALGASRLLAHAGAIGTDGGGLGQMGGGGTGPPDGGGEGGGGASGDGEMVAGPDGMAVGSPGSMEERLASIRQIHQRGPGPKPVVGWTPETQGPGPGSGGVTPSSGSSDEAVPDDFRAWIGPYVPGKMRFYATKGDRGPQMISVSGRNPPPWVAAQRAAQEAAQKED
jgi:hypothetical protein